MHKYLLIFCTRKSIAFTRKLERKLARRTIKVFSVTSNEVTFVKRHFCDFYDSLSLSFLRIYSQIKLSSLPQLLWLQRSKQKLHATLYYSDPRIFFAINPSPSRRISRVVRAITFSEVAGERYIKTRRERAGCCKVETFRALISHTLSRLVFLAVLRGRHPRAPLARELFDVNDYKVTGTLRHTHRLIAPF